MACVMWSVGVVYADDDAAPDAVPQHVIATVQTVPLRQRAMAETVIVYGVVTSDARQVMSVSVPHSGQIIALNVIQGQQVHKGQVLLTLLDTPENEQSWSLAQSNLKLAKSERLRTATLLAQHLATASQMAVADQALSVAQTQLATLRKLGMGQRKTILRASIDGVVNNVLVAKGDRVTANMPLMNLSPIGTQQVQLFVELADAQRMQVGMAVQVRSLLDQRRIENGHIVGLGQTLDPATGQETVWVAVPAGVLMSGERVEARVIWPAQQLIVVPRSAVLNDQIGAYIYQIKNAHAVRVTVQTGVADAAGIAVNGRFIPNAPVVAVGNYELSPDMAVRDVPMFSMLPAQEP